MSLGSTKEQHLANATAALRNWEGTLALGERALARLGCGGASLVMRNLRRRVDTMRTEVAAAGLTVRDLPPNARRDADALETSLATFVREFHRKCMLPEQHVRAQRSRELRERAVTRLQHVRSDLRTGGDCRRALDALVDASNALGKLQAASPPGDRTPIRIRRALQKWRARYLEQCTSRVPRPHSGHQGRRPKARLLEF